MLLAAVVVWTPALETEPFVRELGPADGSD
jgi:hypothetical protein